MDGIANDLAGGAAEDLEEGMTSEKKAERTLKELEAAAEKAVQELEKLEPESWTEADGRAGTAAPWSGEKSRAEGAVRELRDAAMTELFPDKIEPAGADVAADFVAYVGQARNRDGSYYAVTLLSVHRGSLDTHPELAAMLRRAHVLRNFVVDVDEGDKFAAAVAEQLVGRPEGEPAASALAATVPKLRSRINMALEGAKTKAAKRMRKELAAWFRDKGVTRIGREVFEKGEISERIEAGDKRIIDNARHYWVHHPSGGGKSRRGQPIFS